MDKTEKKPDDLKAEDHKAAQAARKADDASPAPRSKEESHGAQVRLTGQARDAARGAVHGDIVANTHARDAAVAAGEATHEVQHAEDDPTAKVSKK